MKVRNLSSVVTVCCVGLFAVSCGSKGGSSNDDSTTMSTEESTAESVADQMDDVADTISEDSASAALALDSSTDSQISRACVASDGNATVTNTYNVSRTMSGGSGKMTHTLTRSGTFVREWTHPAAATGNDLISCVDGKVAKIRWASETAVEGLVLKSTIKRKDSNAMTNKAGKTAGRTREVETIRLIKWTDQADGGDTVVMTKTVSGSSARIFTKTNFNGKKIVMTNNVEIPATPAFTVKVTRAKSTGVWTSKLIQAGKTVVTNKDGGKVETTFENVEYQKATACLPVAGKISGDVYDKGGNKLKSFVVKFENSNPQISWDNGTTYSDYEYDGAGCELEDAT